MAEIAVLLEGLQAIRNLQLSSIEVNNDSMELVNIAMGISPTPWSLRNLVLDILSLFDTLTLHASYTSIGLAIL